MTGEKRERGREREGELRDMEGRKNGERREGKGDCLLFI